MEPCESQNKYLTVDTLNEKHGIYLVREAESGRQYVKKILTVYSADVYRTLFDYPVSHVPRIHELCEQEGLLTVYEEYVYGQNLKDILETAGRPDEAKAADIIRKLCIILQKLHSFSPPIVHRDIKPSNIIISPDDEVWLIDLNASKFENSDQSKDTVLIGTEGYAAPEQYGFGSSNTKTDIYAVGILLNELLTGALPSSKKAEGPFLEIIEKCTKLDPTERYASVSDIIAALDKLGFSEKETGSKKEHKYHRWLPPGFRSGHVRKMVISGLAYALLFATGITLQVDNAGPEKLLANRIAYIIIGLIMILFFANYGNIWKILGITKIKRTWLRVVIMILAGAFIFFVLMLIFAAINQNLK